MNLKRPQKNKLVLKFNGVIAKIYHKKFGKNIFEYVVLPDAARVIAVTDDKKILLLKEKNFSSKKAYFALPGGFIKVGETPKLAALREMEEETGYTSNDIVLWFSKNYSQTIISNKFYFIARNCKKNGILNLDSTEKINVCKLNYNKFLECVLQNEFKNTEIQNKFFKIKINTKENKNFKKLLKLA